MFIHAGWRQVGGSHGRVDHVSLIKRPHRFPAAHTEQLAPAIPPPLLSAPCEGYLHLHTRPELNLPYKQT